MRTIWQSLLWKEWHEHKWKLASIVMILWSVIAYTILTSKLESDLIQLAMGLVIVCMMPLSMFVALGDAAGERSRNTLPFLLALPVSARRVAAIRLVLGLGTLIAAVVLTCLFVLAWSFVSSYASTAYASAIERTARGGPWSLTGNPLFDYTLIAAFVAASLYLWSAAAGVNRKDEVSAGAAALLVIVGTWLLIFGLGRVLSFEEIVNDEHAVEAIAVLSAPGGGVGLPDFGRDMRETTWLSLTIVLATHVALAVVFVRRFGRVANREIVSPRGQRVDMHVAVAIGSPRRSPLSAVLWKQTRESGPIALAGLVVVVAVVVVMAIENLTWYIDRPGQLAEMFAGVSMSMGMVIAMVIGIGTFFYDIGPQLSTFWRSRPIGPNLWFWSKVLTGLAILLAAIYVPTLLALIASGMTVDNVSVWSEPEVLIFPVAHMAIFAAAAAMTCLVRHAVYAAILSIPAAVSGVLVTLGGLWLATRFDWFEAGSWGDRQHRDLEIVATYLAGFLLSFVANLLLAWLAVRYDWGRKSRY